MAEEVGFETGGFTLMGRSNMPEATRFSMRPLRINMAPKHDSESLGSKISLLDHSMACISTLRHKISPSYLAKHTGPEAAE